MKSIACHLTPMAHGWRERSDPFGQPQLASGIGRDHSLIAFLSCQFVQLPETIMLLPVTK